MDPKETARDLLSPSIKDEEVPSLIVNFLDSCTDENGNLWLEVGTITADEITWP